MIYPDDDYIKELYWIIRELSYYIRKSKQLKESSINKMEILANDLLDLLEQYKNDKYNDY